MATDSDDRGARRSIDPLQRRYRSIFDSASVGLWDTDLSRVRAYLDALDTGGLEVEAYLQAHREHLAHVATLWSFREVNDAALTSLRCKRSELPGSLGEIVRRTSEDAWLSLLTAVAQGAARFETELRLNHHQGDTHVLMSMTLPRDDADLAHVVVSMLDITERKRLERELWTAQRMEAIVHLTGGVAHDFNNSLMVISSYAGFVLDQLPEGNAARDDVKIIQDSAARAAELTNQLLAFGRRQVQQLEIMSLNGVVAELDKMLQRVIGEDIELVTRLDPEIGWVKADRLQVEQILMNLAVNARDAMPSGGRLTIETANADIDAAAARSKGDQVPVGSYAMLAVRDSGVGMDAATRERIFEPFFSTKDRGRATGLGLSTVYGIVMQSQGHIAVHSEPGRGSAFEIYLPRVQEHGDGRHERAASRTPPARGETVLLVEDEELVRVAARRILEKHGYAVLEAHHGPDALELCARHEAPIDLMITDVVMPRMNGRDLAVQMKQLRPTMKVIYVSGYADNAIARDGSLPPGSVYIQKPFSPDTLLRKVREQLDCAG
jgi:two-component system, cell cycle sensor histidine kinase and response regulator CckA